MDKWNDTEWAAFYALANDAARERSTPANPWVDRDEAERAKNECLLCGEKLSGEIAEVIRVIPLGDGEYEARGLAHVQCYLDEKDAHERVFLA